MKNFLFLFISIFIASCSEKGLDSEQITAANLDADKPRYFERAVYYSGVGSTLVAQLEDQAAREGMTLLERANAVVQSSDADDSGTQERFRLGVYFYREPLDVPADRGARGLRDPRSAQSGSVLVSRRSRSEWPGNRARGLPLVEAPQCPRGSQLRCCALVHRSERGAAGPF